MKLRASQAETKSDAMRPNVVQLREFYASALGARVRRSLSLAVRGCWPELAGDTLVGVGYANPALRSFLRQEKHDKATIFSLMPAAQGAVVWPDYGANRSVLYKAGRFPLRDHQLNRLLLVHALEHSEDEAQLLAECWRVLVPGGRMIVVVPSRRSMWSRGAATPFSHGKPYSAAQLREVVCEQFTLVQTRGVLSYAPSQSRWLLKLSGVLERLSPWLSPMLGGAILMEVEKQLYAGVKDRKAPRRLADYVPAAVKPALSRVYAQNTPRKP